MKDLEMWRKILGTRVKSFTDNGKTYTVLVDKDGGTCDCPDFRFRKGSHVYRYIDENGKTREVKTCKHVAKAMVERGMKLTEIVFWKCRRSFCTLEMEPTYLEQ